MTESKNLRSAANRALTVVLAGGVIAWVLFIAARFIDLRVNAGRTWNDVGDPQPGDGIQPSTYLIFGAIAVLTVCALIGRRTVARVRQTDLETTLPRAVLRFSSTVLIIGMVLAAIAAISVFLMNFLDGEHDASVTERIVNAYLPIVLYTALVISAILTGFVFTRPVHARENTEPVRVDQVWPHANEGAQGEPVVAPGQREIAVAYTLPIVAVAVALIFGLIVYDITQTRLEAWIWVIVLTIVAVGLTIGAIFASRAMRPLLRAGIMPKGVSVGAKNLNFVLSVLFAVTVTGMAMGYGTSAIYQLQVQPMLSISAYSQSEFGGNSGMPVEDMIFNVWGADLERGSEATLTVEPVGEFVATKTVDRYGSVSFEEQAAEGLEPGTYELVVEAATIDGRTPTVSMTFTVTEELRVEIPGSSGEHIEEAARIITPNLGWYLGDLLAAAVLLALVCGTLYVTLNARNTQFSRHDLQQLRLASAAESD